MPATSTLPTLMQGRTCVLLAAILWSLSGAFSKILTRETALGVHIPSVEPLPMAFWRVVFAGLVLLPTLRRSDLAFHPTMALMVGMFAAMNALFVSALTLGSAANALTLQYTAPLWITVVSIVWFREPADRRGLIALGVGMVGIAVLIAGGWSASRLFVVALALGSGAAYAGVVLCLRSLRSFSSRWLTVLNMLGSGLALLLFLDFRSVPTPAQLVVLFLFGSVQLAIPYWLVARGLRVVGPQEAGTLTLIEPILSPVWAYLTVGEVPSTWEILGAAFILGGLAWRYWPRSEQIPL